MCMREMRSPLDAVHVQEVASGDERGIERVHDLAYEGSGPAIVQLGEAHRLVVRGPSDPQLGHVGPHLLLAVQPARAVGAS
jgi:hypothetical protein